MKVLRTLLIALVVLSIPLFLIMTISRIGYPYYLRMEYNRPNFPADPYGFTQADRLQFGTETMMYLFNSADITYLENLRFPDGTPIYNERELGHMVDVKVVVQNMLRFHNLLVLALIAVGLLAWRMRWLDDFWLAVSTGGWATIGLIVAIGLTVILAFNAFFTLFHKLLGFQGDTWLFSYSDTLIRLYPMNFWQDAFLLVGAITAVLALLLAFGARRLADYYGARNQ